MRRVIVTLSCDVCAQVVTYTEDDDTTPENWATPTLRMQGALVECAVCPRCLGDLIDPPDDIAGDMRRVLLENRL